ncbi:Bud site selection protein BUD4 [Candida viswanathii]|uniref:Bud site selection protein BUD4 n=1 Tax=Candida viswanathii TaxID=5486 RepID=A0A367YG47_9ASCO|nr:Bud site selection protein BUD4 [Candida viswanathii]
MSNYSLVEAEESRHLISPSPSTSHDLFKHENESVDMLLKEMNLDPNKLLENPNMQNESSSIYNSPTKPLNFPRTNSKPLLDPNSSSDTYTSDHDEEKVPKQQQQQQQQQQPQEEVEQPEEKEQPQSSFDRNFEIDNSIDLQQTINNNNNNNRDNTPTTQNTTTFGNIIDEFSFNTPMTSTVDLLNNDNNDNKNTTATGQKPTYVNTSPSKSIMKKTPTASPKKVAFISTIPEIHHYPNNRMEQEDTSEPKLQLPSIQHQWKAPELNYSDEDTNASVPPTPPPHTSKPTFAELLSRNATTQEAPSSDEPTLTHLHLEQDNYSNLSLDEKVNLYLGKDSSSNSKNVSDLDSHLQELQEASKTKTQDNIHNLSFSLQTPKTEIENPLNSLASPDVQLRSSGSSQSSLQSLRDNNRTLESVPGSPTKSNPGLSLNDGIKGLSDDVVESLLPRDESQEMLNMRTISISRHHHVSSDDQLDSFDRSYNKTEESILNLLNSASQSQLSLQRQESGREEPAKDVQLHDEPSLEEEEEEPIKLKIEPGLEPVVQNAVEDDVIEPIALKREPGTSEPSASEPVTIAPLLKQEHSTQSLLKFEHSVHVSEITGLTPQEEIDRYKEEHNIPKSEYAEESMIAPSESSRMSIQFHVTREWRLEDSNDGDREDNDEATRMESSEILGNVSNSSTETADYRDASSELILQRSLAPPRTPTRESASATPKLDNSEETFEQQPADKEDDTNDHIIANSSNIAPPDEITLPMLEQNDYSSFNELTKNMDTYSTFEESLSAEHDLDTKPVSFISIWHKQEKQKKKQMHKVPTKQIIADYKELKQEEEQGRKMSTDHVRIPSNLQSRKFKEVNVMSRRVVSPDMFDLQVSEFLPELSQDSGFENLNFANYTASKRRSMTPLSTKNVLSNIDNDPNVIEPPEPRSYSEMKRARRLSSNQLAQSQHHYFHNQPQYHHLQPQQPDHSTKRTSRFRVPTFEIKRTTSALSPRDMYNDIFDDFGKSSSAVRGPPTIKADGMKTLPSMDKEDVKRILSAKKGMTQEEYINAKYIDQEEQSKKSVVTNAQTRFDELQQTASIHNATFESSPSRQVSNPTNGSNDYEVLPYLTDELRKSPMALLSANQIFNEQESYPSRTSSVLFRPSANSSVLPEPDFELINSPTKGSKSSLPETIHASVAPDAIGTDTTQDGLATGQQAKDALSPSTLRNEIKDDVSVEDIPMEEPVTPKQEVTPKKNTVVSPKSPRKSPIKIGSPMKLVKKNGSITGMEPIAKKHKATQSFDGTEIMNSKLREGPQTPIVEKENDQHIPSTVTVPSEYADALSSPEGNQKPKAEKPHHKHKHKHGDSHPPVVDDELPDVAYKERGKLFFRVMGIKNINLPDIGLHNGKFSMTLDNGVHSVTTPTYLLDGHKVAIGKEFELTVTDTLEFILTMKMSYEKPRGKLVEVTERKVIKSKNRLSRLFGSKDIITTTKFVPTEVKDTWSNKFAQDGSFARCYIDLHQFEDKITGKALQFDLNCFNEWEMNASFPGDRGLQRRNPYTIAQLEVKMLFVPRSDPREVLPTSIRTAYESIEELNQEFNTTHEGYLHQEGGDCPIFKRRFFKLQGTSLLAHSEISHKTRAKINLSKVVDIIYVDKENINMAKYRNFSDVLLVEHSFKIKFANGELIDFCAPNKKEMKQWIHILELIVYRNRFRRQPWVNLMIQENSRHV